MARKDQIAAMRDVVSQKDFNADKHRLPYLEWFDAPAKALRNGSCMILISGGGYYNPAYVLSDGANGENAAGGNDDRDVINPEFSFDLKTAPTLFLHGDADGYAAWGAVKCWEKMRAIGMQGELHTLALRKHCFQHEAAAGTGSYTYLDRIWDFLTEKKINH